MLRFIKHTFITNLQSIPPLLKHIFVTFLPSREKQISSLLLVCVGGSAAKRTSRRILIFRKHFLKKKVREKSRECHNHKPQPFPDPKRKRKPINLNKHKPNRRTKSTKISSLFPKRGNRNTKGTENTRTK